MKRITLLIAFLLAGILSSFSHSHYPPRHPVPHPFPDFHFYPSYTFIFTNTTYIHRLGNIHADTDLSSDINDIENIDFQFWLDSSFKKAESKLVYFSDSGYNKIEKNIIDVLEKKEVPEGEPDFNILKSYSLENDNILKLNFSTPNECFKSSYDSDDRYIYNMVYSLKVPYNDLIKSQIDELNSKAFKDELDRFLYRKKNLRIAGISVFITGFGLFGALNIAGLITLANTVNNGGVPIAVPISLFSSGFGSMTISLGVGVPIWVHSYAKKKFTINFGK